MNNSVRRDRGERSRNKARLKSALYSPDTFELLSFSKDFIILDDLGAIAGFEAKDFENVEPKK